MLKLLHTADFHIGAGFSAFGAKLAQKAEEIQFLAVSSMINYANLNQIDAILIAGDTFDSHVVDFQIRSKLFSILSNFNGKIFLTCGNHDYYFMGSFWDSTDIPENCTVVKSNEWQVFKEDKFTLFASSFSNIYEKISFSSINLDENKINIGLVHADILTSSKYNPLSKNDIKSTNLNYLAVGHNHKFSEILKVADTFYSAPGNISATGFDEVSEKGFIVITFDENTVNHEFISSNGLEIFNFNLDVSSFSSNLDIKNEMLKKSRKNMLVKLNLIGIDNFQIDVSELEKSLTDDFFAIFIENSTDKPENLWRFIEDDNLLGEFTRLMRIKYDSGENSPEVLNALKLGIDALIF